MMRLGVKKMKKFLIKKLKGNKMIYLLRYIIFMKRDYEKQNKLMVGIVCILLSFGNFMSLIGLILAHVYRADIDIKLNLYNYYTYLIRTFWINANMVVFMRMYAPMEKFAALTLLVFFSIWSIGRLIYVFIKSINNKPLKDVNNLWI